MFKKTWFYIVALLVIIFLLLLLALLVLKHNNKSSKNNKPTYSSVNNQESPNSIEANKVKKNLKLEAAENQYIVNCLDNNNYAFDINKNIQLIRDIFQKGDINKNKLAYSITLPDSESDKKIAILQNYLLEVPNSQLAFYELVKSCFYSSNHSSCGDYIENNINEMIIDNSAIWMKVAALRKKRKNISGAVEALREAINANLYNEYWGERFDLAYEALEENINDANFSLFNIYNAISFSKDGMTPETEIFSLCNDEINKNSNVAHICLSVAEKMVNSKSQEVAPFGFAIQKIFYKRMNDENNLAEIEAIEKINDNFYETELYFKTVYLMHYDRELFRYWLEKAKIQGERQAYEDAIDEAIRLSKNKNYNPCELPFMLE